MRSQRSIHALLLSKNGATGEQLLDFKSLWASSLHRRKKLELDTPAVKITDRVLPVLFREDYLAFRQLAPDLPETFDAWKAAHIEQLRSAYRFGQTPVDVVVYPTAFVQFLRQHGSKASLQTLEAFALDKARR